MPEVPVTTYRSSVMSCDLSIAAFHATQFAQPGPFTPWTDLPEDTKQLLISDVDYLRDNVEADIHVFHEHWRATRIEYYKSLGMNDDQIDSDGRTMDFDRMSEMDRQQFAIFYAMVRSMTYKEKLKN